MELTHKITAHDYDSAEEELVYLVLCKLCDKLWTCAEHEEYSRCPICYTECTLEDLRQEYG